MNVIAKTAVMREREFATQVLSPQHLNPNHARMGNGNVTMANAFEENGMTTVNVIAKIAVMSQIFKIASQQLSISILNSLKMIIFYITNRDIHFQLLVLFPCIFKKSFVEIIFSFQL